MKNMKNSIISGIERWALIALIFVFVALWVAMAYVIFWPIPFRKMLVTWTSKRLVQRSTSAEALPS